jgi:uncharacterized membrane protein YuzA (DUF378 family)
VKASLGRIATLPFEAFVAVLALQAGLMGLFLIGSTANVLDAVLGAPLAHVFQAGYAVSGLLMLVGIGLGRADIEGFGLMLLSTSVVIRTIALAYLLGATADVAPAILTASFTVLFSALRLRHLLRHETIIRTNGGLT